MFTQHRTPLRPTSPAPNVVERFAAVEAARAAKPQSRYLSHPVGTLYMALTVLILSYGALFNVLPILIYLCLWLSLPLLKGMDILRPTPTVLWVLSIPAFSLLSSLWSPYPMNTLYLSAEYTAMVLSVIVICRTVPFRAFAEGLSIGCTITLLLTLYSGRYGVDYMTGSYSLMGYFSSKNAVGSTAQMALFAAIVLLFSTRGLLRKTCVALVPIAVAIPCLLLSRSGTALLSFVIPVVLMAGLVVLIRMPRQLRPVLLGSSILILTATVAIGFSMGGREAVLKALGKDATLTGRTYLWQEGKKIGWERPLLGHGYAGFWVPGEPRAERYWYEFGIADRTGFHFHSTLVQTFVDLGIVGLLLVVLTLLNNIYRSMKALLRPPLQPEAVLMFFFAAMSTIRAFVEVDIFGPFGMGVFIFFGIALRFTEMPRLLTPPHHLTQASVNPST